MAETCCLSPLKGDRETEENTVRELGITTCLELGFASWSKSAIKFIENTPNEAPASSLPFLKSEPPANDFKVKASRLSCHLGTHRFRVVDGEVVRCIILSLYMGPKYLNFRTNGARPAHPRARSRHARGLGAAHCVVESPCCRHVWDAAALPLGVDAG